MEKGLQSKELAERLSISRPYMSQIEKGIRMPSEELLTKLSVVLEVSKDWLVGLSQSSTPAAIHSAVSDSVKLYCADCPECKKKDVQIQRLERIIDKLTK
jgi:transcriptional regulator with XRE-family HTH domain